MKYVKESLNENLHDELVQKAITILGSKYDVAYLESLSEEELDRMIQFYYLFSIKKKL